MAKQASNEQIADYQEASESGRDCSERIFQSFYLSLIFLALVITAIIAGYDRYPVVLPTISIISAISFLILFLTIHINRGPEIQRGRTGNKLSLRLD